MKNNRIALASTILTLGISAPGVAQVPPATPSTAPSISKVEPGSDGTATSLLSTAQLAQFPGGDSALYAFIGQNLNYPTAARDHNIQDIVYVRLIVTKSGRLDSIQVIKSLGYGVDDEAVRVVRSMPKWKLTTAT